MILYAQQVCLLCQQMATAGSDGSSRETLIRVATSDSLSASLLFEVFPHIRENHPGIHLTLTTAGTEELFRLLDHNEVDVVCTLDSHIYNTNYRIAGEKKVGVHFLVNSASPLAEGDLVSMADLLAQDLLLTEKGMSYRRLLDEWLAQQSLEVRPVLEAGQADLICTLVEMGLGCAFLPDYITGEAAARGTVKCLNVEGFQPELWKQILCHRKKWVSPSMQAVLDIMVKHWL